MVRKAVIIWGYRDSGKTTTIRYLLKRNSRLDNGIYHINNKEGQEIKVFVQGQSPSEKEENIEKLIEISYNDGCLPDNIIVAEQIDGINSGNTLNFLIENKYKITFFVIHTPPKCNKTHWDYQIDINESKEFLNKRAEDITAIFD